MSNLFADLTSQVESDEPLVSEIESLCLNCKQNGMTKLLLTTIPFYRQVVVMSFHCAHCGWSNNELQPAQQIGEKGVKFAVKCTDLKVRMIS